MNYQTETTNDCYYRLEQILKKFQVSRSTWYRWIDKGNAPKPIKFSEGVARWKASDIQKFEDSREYAD